MPCMAERCHLHRRASTSDSRFVQLLRAGEVIGGDGRSGPRSRPTPYNLDTCLTRWPISNRHSSRAARGRRNAPPRCLRTKRLWSIELPQLCGLRSVDDYRAGSPLGEVAAERPPPSLRRAVCLLFTDDLADYAIRLISVNLCKRRPVRPPNNPPRPGRRRPALPELIPARSGHPRPDQRLEERCSIRREQYSAAGGIMIP